MSWVDYGLSCLMTHCADVAETSASDPPLWYFRSFRKTSLNQLEIKQNWHPIRIVEEVWKNPVCQFHLDTL